MNHSVNEDALRIHLQEKFNKLKKAQEEKLSREVDVSLAAQTERNKVQIEKPKLELISEETASLFDELDQLASLSNKAPQLLPLIAKARSAVNSELRSSLSYLEEGYVSAFEAMKSNAEAISSCRDAQRNVVPQTESLQCSEVNPKGDWKPHVLQEIRSEEKYKQSNRSSSKPKATVVKEALSEYVSLFAESLATLLSCAVVRIYLYDENKSLHCSAMFPFRSTEADPMRATYKEIMLAKELHHSVCTMCLAINGSNPNYALLGAKDKEQIQQELHTNCLDSVQSCLVFPILSHKGSNRCLGMIHAANKMAYSGVGNFSEHDEIIVANASRLLGVILSRYPQHYFTLDVGERFRKAVDPHYNPADIREHLPDGISDVVEEAAEVASRAVATPGQIMVFRAPINNIYETSAQRLKYKKLGSLAQNDRTLASVEFNLASIGGLWETGMEENVEMHKQYRALHQNLDEKKALLRNILDGLAVTRSMTDSLEMARYLQRLELFGRSENTTKVSELITETLLKEGNENPSEIAMAEGSIFLKSSPRLTTRNPAVPPLSSLPTTARSQSPFASKATEADFSNHPENLSYAESPSSKNPFLNREEKEDLLRQNTYFNSTKASHLHYDGPEYIRTYTVDPNAKRSQVQFINELQKYGMQSVDFNSKDTQKDISRSQGAEKSLRLPIPEKQLRKPNDHSTKKNVADFSNQRPFQLKKL